MIAAASASYTLPPGASSVLEFVTFLVADSDKKCLPTQVQRSLHSNMLLSATLDTREMPTMREFSPENKDGRETRVTVTDCGLNTESIQDSTSHFNYHSHDRLVL